MPFRDENHCFWKAAILLPKPSLLGGGGEDTLLTPCPSVLVSLLVAVNVINSTPCLQMTITNVDPLNSTSLSASCSDCVMDALSTASSNAWPGGGGSTTSTGLSAKHTHTAWRTERLASRCPSPTNAATSTTQRCEAWSTSNTVKSWRRAPRPLYSVALMICRRCLTVLSPPVSILHRPFDRPWVLRS